MLKRIINFLKDEEGSNAAEYALLVSLIAVAIMAGAYALGQAVNNKLDDTAGDITDGYTP